MADDACRRCRSPATSQLHMNYCEPQWRLHGKNFPLMCSGVGCRGSLLQLDIPCTRTDTTDTYGWPMLPIFCHLCCQLAVKGHQDVCTFRLPEKQREELARAKQKAVDVSWAESKARNARREANRAAARAEMAAFQSPAAVRARREARNLQRQIKVSRKKDKLGPVPQHATLDPDFTLHELFT